VANVATVLPDIRRSLREFLVTLSVRLRPIHARGWAARLAVVSGVLLLGVTTTNTPIHATSENTWSCTGGHRSSECSSSTVPTVPAARRERLTSTLFSVPSGWPKQLQIPRIRVTASVEDKSLSTVADLHVPSKWDEVAWYDRGPRPGDRGRATIFGHKDSTCCPAVFWRLGELRSGDTLRVIYTGGRTLAFRVLWEKVYQSTGLPMTWLFGHTRDRGLTLMSCAGKFHRDGTDYHQTRVVYARVLLPNGRLG